MSLNFSENMRFSLFISTVTVAVGQPVALNLSQSARSRLASVIPIVNSVSSVGSQGATGAHPVSAKTGLLIQPIFIFSFTY